MVRDEGNIIQEFVEALDFRGTEGLDEILGYVLAKARRITSAEAGSIFVPEPLLGGRKLRCMAVQNDRVEINAESFVVPIDSQSIVGFCALEGEVVQIEDLYRLGTDKPYKFNPAFDNKYDYRSVSMLSVPLRNIKNEVTGVIQLINHITGVDGAGEPAYGTFTLTDVENMSKLALIIGMLVERMALIEEIERLKRLVA